MRVAIIGTGGVALSYAAALHLAGHEPALWSVSGRGTAAFQGEKSLESHGAIEARLKPVIPHDLRSAIENADVVIFAVRANATRAALEAVAPHLEDRHDVILSSHYSFAAIHLLKLTAERGVRPTIIGWASTVAAGRRTGETRVDVQYVRTRIDVAAIPASEGERALALCENLFGNRFRLRADFMTIVLSNMNPHVHMALILGNLSRVERGDEWRIYSGFTPALSNMVQELDNERFKLAEAAGVDIRSVKEHFALTHDVQEQRIDRMCENIHAIGRGSLAPKSIETHYIMEDVPYGLCPTVALARKMGVSIPLHEAGIILFNAITGEDLPSRNDLLPAMRFEDMSLEAVRLALTHGQVSRLS